jgi:hypothetical protein
MANYASTPEGCSLLREYPVLGIFFDLLRKILGNDDSFIFVYDENGDNLCFQNNIEDISYENEVSITPSDQEMDKYIYIYFVSNNKKEINVAISWILYHFLEIIRDSNKFSTKDFLENLLFNVEILSCFLKINLQKEIILKMLAFYYR